MFRQYKTIYYPFKSKDGTYFAKLVPDLSTSIKIQLDLINAASYFEYFKIDAVDTPESIAHAYYGDVKLHYLVMLSNNIFNWVEDFPMTDYQLEAYVEENYTSPDAIHHYVNSKTNEIIDKNNQNIGEFDVPVTNYEYENDLNEKRKHIKLLRKEMIPQIEEMIADAMGNR